MEKKYKHKKTGRIVTEKDTFYYLESEGNFPKWAIENSNDWEEITKDYVGVCFKIGKCDGLIYKISQKEDDRYRIVWENNPSGTTYSEYMIEGFFKECIWIVVSNEEYEKQNRKKLFTTEDGVDIFEGDSYYFVNKRTLSHVNKNNVANDISGGNNISFVYFSTEQKAKEYIDMNLPKYSEKDVIKILRGMDDELNQYKDSDENYIEFIKRYK